jgi:hypothetical protein
VLLPSAWTAKLPEMTVSTSRWLPMPGKVTRPASQVRSPWATTTVSKEAPPGGTSSLLRASSCVRAPAPMTVPYRIAAQATALRGHADAT